MNHKNLKKFLEFSLNQSIKGNYITPILWGHSGFGKTTGVKNAAKQIGAEFIYLNLATQDPGDLIGLPTRVKDKTSWLKPEWMPSKEFVQKKYIILLDEFNRVQHQSVMDIMLSFLLERRIHNHELPQNCLLVAAANPSDDNYSVSSLDDCAMISRLCHVKFSSSFEEWKNYCGRRVHKSVSSFMRKSEIFTHGDNFELPMRIADPRNAEMVGIGLSDISKQDFESFGKEFIIGMMGDGANIIYQDFLNPPIDENISAEEFYFNDKVDVVNEILSYNNVTKMEVIDSAIKFYISAIKSFQDSECWREKMDIMNDRLVHVYPILDKEMCQMIIRHLGEFQKNGNTLGILPEEAAFEPIRSLWNYLADCPNCMDKLYTQ